MFSNTALLVLFCLLGALAMWARFKWLRKATDAGLVLHLIVGAVTGGFFGLAAVAWRAGIRI